MYIKFDGVDGEVTTTAHAGWIEVTSYSHGVAMAINESTVSAGSRSAGRAQVSDFSFTKMMDKASVPLTFACITGKSYPTITMEITRSGEGKQETYMTYKLEGALISSVSVGGAGEGVPSESVTLAPAKLTWTYMPTSGKTGAQAKKVENSIDLTTLGTT